MTIYEAIRRLKGMTYVTHANPDDYVQLADWLLELTERRETDKWVPISERLPEENVDVLLGVKHEGKSKCIVSKRYDFNFWEGAGREIIGDVRWMPLPEMWEDETKEEEQPENLFGQRVADQLSKKGMSQRELAEKAGITEVSISRYISGARVPKATVILAIAKVLHVTCDYLLGVSGEPG